MIEKIDLENYEAFFLDFSEGNLSMEQIDMLNKFLEENPHLRAELDDFEAIALAENDAEEQDWKSELKREEMTGLTRLDYLLISEVEGKISAEEKKELAIIAESNPSVMKELNLYRQTKLPILEEGISIEKSRLIRKEPKVIVWWHYASVAAAVLVLILFNWNNEGREYQPQELAFGTKLMQEEKAKPNYALIVESEDLKEEELVLPIQVRLKNSEELPALNYANNRTEKEQLDKKVNEEKLEQIEDPSSSIAMNKEESPSPKEETPQKESKPMESPEEVLKDEMAMADTGTPKKNTEEFVPINEFAKKKIKTDVLKGKTFSETVMEEIAEISNDKIVLETQKDASGERESFALNIGKFSFSRNK